MVEPAARAVAKAFVDARRDGRALATYPGAAPTTIADAYTIQDAALSLSEKAVVGWKVGRINPPLDAALGTNRLAGPVLDGTIAEYVGRPVTMPVFHGGFAAAEAEFMLRLAMRDAPLPASNEDVLDWIDEIRIGIEIASSPYPGINDDGPCVTISDQGNNAGLLLGATVPRRDWDALDRTAVSVTRDGILVGSATTATMLDGPFGAARFLLENLASRGIRPQSGCWISSGAITGVHEVRSGSVVVATFAGIGEVSCLIAGAHGPLT